MDKVIIRQAKFMCYLGINEKELESKREIILDIELLTDIKKPAQTDDIDDAVDYRKVHDVVKTVIDSKKFHLIETIAESVAQAILKDFEKVKMVFLRLNKPSALSERDVEASSVEILRVRNG